jgi:hypothetical protein
MEDHGWEGDNRREIKRRFDIDRRSQERRKRYWWTVLFPLIIGIIGTAVLSWGAYVTHTTYGISAKYEQTFVSHIRNQIQKDADTDHKLEITKIEHARELDKIRKDMKDGFSEMRKSQDAIYNLIISQQR